MWLSSGDRKLHNTVSFIEKAQTPSVTHCDLEIAEYLQDAVMHLFNPHICYCILQSEHNSFAHRLFYYYFYLITIINLANVEYFDIHLLAVLCNCHSA